jgi:hypothetical protein
MKCLLDTHFVIWIVSKSRRLRNYLHALLCKRTTSHGITILRRPNRRESIENAPGPRIPTAPAITTTTTAEALSCMGCSAPMGTANSTAQAADNAPNVPPIGVKKPINNKSPLANATMARITTGKVSSSALDNKYAPAEMSTRPTVDRNNSRATPGNPAGNDENSLCMRASSQLALWCWSDCLRVSTQLR